MEKFPNVIAAKTRAERGACQERFIRRTDEKGVISLAAPLGTMTRANRAVIAGVTGSSFPVLPEGDTASFISRVSRQQCEYG